MDAQPLINSICRHVLLSPEEEEAVRKRVESRTLHRKAVLLEPGQICYHSTFVVSGCLRSFLHDRDGVERVLHFAPTGWWIADMASYITSSPATLTLDALEDSELLLLSKEGQQELFRISPKFERFFRILVENSLVTHQRRLLDNLSLPAAERYDQFCRRYPTLVQSLPQKQIAAYLGVTPEFLSKLRKELMRKG
jgi:CRP-like cAMP-binding protein